MSEIENSNIAKQKSHKKFNKKSTRVDLTPMVDLGFLLITFFVFTTSLSQPTVMKLNLPYDKVEGIRDELCESCVLTLLLKKDNSIEYYEGIPGVNTIVKHTSFSVGAIRNILLYKKKQVMQARGRSDEMVLIIKSANESTFQNFVDIVDEVAITGIRRYYVAEIDDTDIKLARY